MHFNEKWFADIIGCVMLGIQISQICGNWLMLDVECYPWMTKQTFLGLYGVAGFTLPNFCIPRH